MGISLKKSEDFLKTETVFGKLEKYAYYYLLLNLTKCLQV